MFLCEQDRDLIHFVPYFNIWQLAKVLLNNRLQLLHLTLREKSKASLKAYQVFELPRWHRGEM